jgi:SAM-dependent methyltransferase
VRHNNFLTRFFHNIFNLFFIIIYQIPKFSSNKFGAGWFLNLERLYKLFLNKNDPKNYHFIDVGCGFGLQIIYAYKKFNFKSYSGFDFSKKNICTSLNNLKKTIGSDVIKNNKNQIRVFYSNANNIKLKNQSYFIFMFNPFKEKTMRNFIKNNYKTFKKNKSVIAYSNYNCLHIIKKYKPNKITKIDSFKLALIEF